MVRVRYTDHTGCNDSVSEYETEQEAQKAVTKELNMTKKMWDNGYLRVLNSPDFAEVYAPGGIEYARWSLECDTAEYAKQFCEAIKTLAENPANLDNLESYLSQHFYEWLKKFAATPEDMAAEMKAFADMKI